MKNDVKIFVEVRAKRSSAVNMPDFLEVTKKSEESEKEYGVHLISLILNLESLGCITTLLDANCVIILFFMFMGPNALRLFLKNACFVLYSAHL